MQKNNRKISNPKSDRKVLIFPALTPPINAGSKSRRQIYFLFSLCQVEDIIREVSVYPVPFSPTYVEGITLWRDHVAPVISLEKYMGLPELGLKLITTRLITIRSSSESEKEERIILRTAPGIRMFSLPIPCEPVPFGKWIPRKEFVRAIYEWKEGYLLVANMGAVFSNPS